MQPPHILRPLVLSVLCAAALLLPPCAAASALISLQGNTPSDVNAEYLETQYNRIEQTLAPSHPPSTAPLAIIFYTRSTRPALARRLPEWGGGGALGPDTIIVPLDVPFALDRSITQVAEHEIVHAVLARAYPKLDIPRWFHEGCAMLLSGEVSLDEQTALSYAVLAGRLPRLAAIDQVNSFDQSSARLAYSLSHACALFIVESYGYEGLRAVLARSERAGNFQVGLKAALGLDEPEFEALAYASIHKRYGLAFILGDLAYVWLIILALAVAAFVVTRVRNRRKKRAMAAQEERERLMAMAAREAQGGDGEGVPAAVTGSHGATTVKWDGRTDG
jgi:hypothetical protein